MAAVITPGIDFILSALAKYGLPPFVVSAAIRTFSPEGSHMTSTWILVSASAISVPFIVSATIAIKRLRHRYQAWKLGARLAPEVQGRWIGNFDVLATLNDRFENDYPSEGLLDLHTEMGPIFNLRLGWSDRIATTVPEHIQRLLATEVDNFNKGKRFHDLVYPVLGDGIFNSDGDMWKFHRNMIRPFFNHDRVKDFDIFDRHADVALSLISDRLRSGHPIDLQDLLLRYTLDVTFVFLFGKGLDSMKEGLPYPKNVQAPPPSEGVVQNSGAHAFAHGFFVSQDVVVSRDNFGPLWPLREIVRDQTKGPMQGVKDYLDPIVKEVLDKRKETRGDVTEEKVAVDEDATLLEHLASLTSDPVVIREDVLNLLLAGRDTVTTALVFTLYLLAMYPNVLARLRAEILEKVGPTRRPNYTDIGQMKYLRAVINESMRLFPPVPFNERESLKDTVWPSPDPSQPPIYIPTGTTILYSPFLMHRRKDLWGPDAEEFDPDRFLDDRLKTYFLKNPFIFLPFNAGPRFCLGQQYAYNEISFIIIRLFQEYSSITLDLDAYLPEDRPKAEWKKGPGRKAAEQVFPKMHLTMYAAGGLWVRLGKADDVAET